MEYTYTIHYEMCDNVLNNLRGDKDMHAVDIESFLGEARPAKLAVMRRLDQDGYIRRVKAQTEPLVASITVKGYQFWAEGGYKEKFTRLNNKFDLENNLLNSNISHNTSVLLSNKVQMIIAAIVLLFVIVSTFAQVNAAKYQKKLYDLEQKKITDDTNKMLEIKKELNSIKEKIQKKDTVQKLM